MVINILLPRHHINRRDSILDSFHLVTDELMKKIAYLLEDILRGFVLHVLSRKSQDYGACIDVIVMTSMPAYQTGPSSHYFVGKESLELVEVLGRWWTAIIARTAYDRDLETEPFLSKLKWC